MTLCAWATDRALPWPFDVGSGVAIGELGGITGITLGSHSGGVPMSQS